jgi:hypothetical protein
MSITPTEAEVLQFGASVAGVAALVPEARLYAGPMPPPEGTYAITVTQVAAWVDELTDAVAMVLDGWERLDDTAVLADDGTVLVLGDRSRLLGSARTIIHNGAASYLEAARHPERAAVNDTSYAAVLWARYTEGLDRLAGWLTRRLEDPQAGDEPEPEDVNGGALYSFPTPLVGDGLRF